MQLSHLLYTKNIWYILSIPAQLMKSRAKPVYILNRKYEDE